MFHGAIIAFGGQGGRQSAMARLAAEIRATDRLVAEMAAQLGKRNSRCRRSLRRDESTAAISAVQPHNDPRPLRISFR